MSATYLKLYDWMNEAIPDLEERIVYALVYQFTVAGQGYWGGYASMASRLGIPKSRCKAAAQRLESRGIIQIGNIVANQKTRLHLKATPEFSEEQEALARE